VSEQRNDSTESRVRRTREERSGARTGGDGRKTEREGNLNACGLNICTWSAEEARERRVYKQPRLSLRTILLLVRVIETT